MIYQILPKIYYIATFIYNLPPKLSQYFRTIIKEYMTYSSTTIKHLNMTENKLFIITEVSLV